MYKICYLDDSYYGIAQVINSIPKDLEYKFYYYNRITDLEDIDFDIVILDFYLDKDNKTALDVIEKFAGSIIIGFSSEDSKNDLILQNGGLYKARKIKDTNENEKLREIFDEIFNTKK